MTNEIEASKHLQSIWKNIDEQRQQQLQDVLSKLEVAIEKHAVVSGIT